MNRSHSPDSILEREHLILIYNIRKCRISSRSPTSPRRVVFSRSTTLSRLSATERPLLVLPSLILGIKAKNGVVICAEKKLSSSLIDETSYSKVQPLSPEIGSTYAGLSPDFFVTMKKARKEALSYFQKYEEPISAYFLCKETAKVMQEFTQMGGVRPFGVSLLMAAFD